MLRRCLSQTKKKKQQIFLGYFEWKVSIFLKCLFLENVIWNFSTKSRIATAALIRGRRLLTFLSQMRRLLEGGAYSGAALI